MLKRFNTPAKRVGLLVFGLGIVIILIAFLPFLETTRFRTSPVWAFIDHLSYGPLHAWQTWGSWARSGAALAGWVGLALVVIGALFAFLYDVIIAPIICWISTGHFRRPK